MAVDVFVRLTKKEEKKNKFGVRICNPLEALHLKLVELLTRVPQSDVEICVCFPITTKAKEKFWC